MTMSANRLTYQVFDRVTYRAASTENIDQDDAVRTTLEQELAQCRIEQSEWKNKFMHLSADFDNFKRRLSKEQALWIQDAQAGLLIDVLAIADDIDRALDHQITTTDQEIRTWLAGFVMIQKSFQDFLKKAGVQEVSYELFDPHFHEALMEVDSSEHTAGQIVAVLQKGYRMGDKVIRHARVSVAR